MNCLTCGILVTSSEQYHYHNINCHNIKELSLTIVRFLFQDDRNYSKENMEPRKTSSSGRIFQECMDEVIELGTVDGDDNFLTVQSLLLKSNFSPNSRHIIELEEKKQTKDVIKVLSEELNAAVVHFQKDCLSTKISGCQSKLENPPNTKEVSTPTKKKLKRRIKNVTPGRGREAKKDTIEPAIQGSNVSSNSVDKESNVKIVLRSGRTIKTNPRYEDFIYYDDFKENSLKNCSGNSTNSTEAKNLSRKVDEMSPHETPFIKPNVPINQKENCFIDFNTRLLDLFPDDFNIDDLNLSSELDIKIQDLDFSGFDDLEGTLPENQILTIENLLQELDGGGSIEISNIIKENNIDSDTVVLDALSQSVNKNLEPQNDRNTSSQLEESLRTNSKIKKGQNTKHFCKICNKSYVSKINFINHSLKYHSNMASNKMLYKCNSCESVFTYLTAFERHLKSHNPEQTFLCEVCGRTLKSLINLKLHSALHKKTVTYQCHLCPSKYFLKYSYLNHLKTHDNQNKLYCQKCDKTFQQKHHFNKHLEKHKKGKYLYMSNDLKCTYCKDIKKVTDLPQEKFENCTKCKKGIYKKYLIENQDYINPETSNSTERKECKICGKYVKNFKKHVRETHLSNPVIECDICGQSVKKACLNSHKFRRHKGIPTKCDHCNKTFKNALALKEHLNKVKKQNTSLLKTSDNEFVADS